MPFYLEADAQRFVRQAHRLLASFDALNHPRAAGGCCSVSHELAASNCVLNLHNHWSQFCKELIINSAKGGFATRAGVTLPRVAGLPLNNDVVAHIQALYHWRAPREPHWSIAAGYGNSIDACTRLGVANLSDISAALGAVGSPAEELRLVRNYLAHRNRDTASRASTALSGYGIGRMTSADTMLRTSISGGSTIYERWVNELSLIAFAAC
mgnify:CR=1 FL=1